MVNVKDIQTSKTAAYVQRFLTRFRGRGSKS